MSGCGFVSAGLGKALNIQLSLSHIIVGVKTKVGFETLYDGGLQCHHVMIICLWVRMSLKRTVASFTQYALVIFRRMLDSDAACCLRTVDADQLNNAWWQETETWWCMGKLNPLQDLESGVSVGGCVCSLCFSRYMYKHRDSEEWWVGSREHKGIDDPEKQLKDRGTKGN